MNNLDAIFNELAENYNVSLEFIKDIYDLLKEKPFISEEDDRIFTCLEMIVQDESEKNNYLETKKNLEILVYLWVFLKHYNILLMMLYIKFMVKI